MSENPLVRLHELGQSVWLDYIRRDLFTTGELKRAVDAGEVTGAISNPFKFEEGIRATPLYNESIKKVLLRQRDISVTELYETLVVQDVQEAADVLRPVYDQSNHYNGYVCLEVSHNLAYQTQETVDQARRLHAKVNRPNLMIKVTATVEGLAAITQLISEGISVNATLMFSPADYEQVANAYMAGLEQRAAAGGDLSTVASVASLFISRIDRIIDPLLPSRSLLRGKLAVANANLTYKKFRDIFSSERFANLRDKGAHLQRPLWTSTSVKDDKYRDVMYVESLIGRDTINTIPTQTLNAFKDHGIVRETLTENIDDALGHFNELEQLRINFETMTAKVKEDSIHAFANDFNALMDTVAEEREDTFTPWEDPAGS